MPADPGRPLAAAEQLLLAELDRRAEPTRAMAAAGGWVYGSVEDLCIAIGRWYRPSTVLPPAVGFSGAAAASKERRAQYVEGYILDEGQVHVAAWAARGEEVVAGPAGAAYLGVPLTERFRRLVCKRSGAAAVLHGQQLDRWRLLIGGLPPGAVP
jgi:hypothetical protein